VLFPLFDYYRTPFGGRRKPIKCAESAAMAHPCFMVMRRRRLGYKKTRKADEEGQATTAARRPSSELLVAALLS
jgi:hypothetical protein